MMVRALRHARSNAIAYLALGVSLLALGGGAYAAVVVPANSVGARQLRNGSIAPAKFDRRFIGGTVRRWAKVSADGRVVSLSGARELEQPNSGGRYLLAWDHDTFSPRCGVIVTVGGDVWRAGRLRRCHRLFERYTQGHSRQCPDV
jgi:hypothetical protein